MNTILILKFIIICYGIYTMAVNEVREYNKFYPARFILNMIVMLGALSI